MEIGMQIGPTSALKSDPPIQCRVALPSSRRRRMTFAQVLREYGDGET
jgi:hypothetical protein